MKKKEFLKLKEMEVKELLSLVNKKKIEVNQTRVKIFSGKEKNLKKVNNLRKEIAQVLTVIQNK